MKLPDLEAMRLAIEQAKLGYGFVSPNPVVGCVILDRDGHLLSHGYHAKIGEDHAEISALKKISHPKLLKDASLYVTLEPCSHQGRTPPCADALASLPIREVIYGVQDPNPKVSGRGVQILRTAGKIVRTLPDLTSEIEELTEIFLFNMRERRSFVALKIATSLDGKMAFSSGESQWITHDQARLQGNELRGFYDAVVVGANTVLQDQPKLTLRHPRFVGKKQSSVIIIDPEGSTLEVLSSTPLALERGGLENIVVVVKDSLRASVEGVRQILCPMLASGALDLQFLTRATFELGFSSLFVEGGARTHSEFLQQRVAQRLYQFVSPILMGGVSAKTWTQFLEISQMKDRIELQNCRWQQVGPDGFFTGIFSNAPN